ncbi:MAG: hypothetical protein QXZ62_08800 [Candidatus Caldarchaeum sp.]
MGPEAPETRLDGSLGPTDVGRETDDDRRHPSTSIPKHPFNIFPDGRAFRWRSVLWREVLPPVGECSPAA